MTQIVVIVAAVALICFGINRLYDHLGRTITDDEDREPRDG